MRTILLIWLSAALCAIVAAQNVRDDWKQLQTPFDLTAHLTHSLADAHLSVEDRAKIYHAVDDEMIHDALPKSQRRDERKIVMSSRVGSIVLADDGSEQILVKGPELVCGANGNCLMWIFVRRRGGLQLALRMSGGALIVRDSSTNGFHDVTTGSHLSADKEIFAVYRWNGANYDEVDCYIAEFGQSGTAKPPLITGCASAP